MRKYCRPNHGRTATSKADVNSLASRGGNTGVDFGRAQGLGLIAPPPGPDQASGEAGTELVDRIGGERQGGGWLPGSSEER
jgi:hypothetical protein